jgi:hypothetical protein
MAPEAPLVSRTSSRVVQYRAWFIREWDMSHFLKDDEQMEWPPVESDTARSRHFSEPHRAQIGIRAAHREPEIDMIGWHRITSSAKERRVDLPRHGRYGAFSPFRFGRPMSDLAAQAIRSQEIATEMTYFRAVIGSCP